MSEMAFNPAVPVPKITEPKSKFNNSFVDPDFYEKCREISKRNHQKTFFTDVVI